MQLDEPVELRVYNAVSGYRFNAQGFPAQIVIDGWKTPAIEVTRNLVINGQQVKKGSLLAIDPRCVITNPSTNFVYYNPRDMVGQLPDWVEPWLDEHPEWPAVLEL